MAIDRTASQIITTLDERVRARIPLMAVVTHEEQRFLRIVQALKRYVDPITGGRRHQDKVLYVWSRTRGMRKVDPDGNTVMEYQDTSDPMGALEFIEKLGSHDGPADETARGLFVLCDFAQYLEPYAGQQEHVPIRALRELAWAIQARHINVFVVGAVFPDILDLEKEVHTIDLPLPNDDELAALLDRALEEFADTFPGKERVSGDRATYEKLVGAMVGLTENEAEAALNIAFIRNGCMDAQAIPVVLEQKREAIRRSGSLEFVEPQPLQNFGGYERIIELVKGAAATFMPEAKAFGIEPHKGFLLLGPPGCGKSYLMQIISGVTSRALLRMSLAAVMGEGGGIVGQSWASARRALQLADALQPVLGIDEYEKGAGGVESSGRSDAGETARAMGYLLTWQAEQQGTMVVATANDVRQLRPEQIREGRFGAKIWVGLPEHEDRKKIFGVHLQKRGRAPGQFSLDKLAEMSERFSGAEIEQAVKNALLYAFMDGGGERGLSPADLERGIKDITPTGLVNKKEIDDLERWAEEKLGAVSASSKELSLTGQRPGSIAAIEVA